MNIRHQGRWLRFCTRPFRNSRGEQKDWEYVTRTGTAGAAGIIAILPDPARLVAVEQYRPPIDAPVLEFPAGLIDEDDGPADTALRELREETGYRGRVIEVSPPVYNSPGLTDEWVCMVRVEVTGRDTARLEPDEAIQVHELPLEDLLDHLHALSRSGLRIDAKLWSFAAALEVGKTAEPLVCERCGKPNATRLGNRVFCAECYELCGSCCLEFGGDDLWKEAGD